jgi:hypothetical protein
MKKLILIFLAIPYIMCTCKAQSINLFGNDISYETGTTILTSVNTVLTTVNYLGVTPKWQTQYTAGVAMVTGAAQIAYGMYTDAQNDFGTLNIVNITAGVATLVTNGILLYQSFHSGSKTSSLNLYSTPVGNGELAMGVTYVIRF